MSPEPPSSLQIKHNLSGRPAMRPNSPTARDAKIDFEFAPRAFCCASHAVGKFKAFARQKIPTPVFLLCINRDRDALQKKRNSSIPTSVYKSRILLPALRTVTSFSGIECRGADPQSPQAQNFKRLCELLQAQEALIFFNASFRISPFDYVQEETLWVLQAPTNK